jgi:LPS-assembly protein
MIMQRLFSTLAVLISLIPLTAKAQLSSVEAHALRPGGEVYFDPKTGDMVSTNGIAVTYDGAVLTAESARVNPTTGDVIAEGDVRLERDNTVWTGQHFHYNFHTHELDTEMFAAGRPPAFAGGEKIYGNQSNQVYTAINAFITTDDISQPAYRVCAKSITVAPGKYFTARNAILYAGDVPIFYFPYYTERLDAHSNRFSFLPGFSDNYGAFLLSSYIWRYNDNVDGVIHADYRERRGLAGGPDLNLHLADWGEMKLRYYYAHDADTEAGTSGPAYNENRHIAFGSYAATPLTNLDIKALASYQSDAGVLEAFSEHQFVADPQQQTFLDADKRWQNFSLDVYGEDRINDFQQTVERLPQVQLTGFRQQLGPTPVYYESQTTVGWYRQLFSNTNSPGIPGYSASRADTYQQLLLPWTFFGWLNVTPHAGGRFTYYGDSTATNAQSSGIYRGVFDTGTEVSFKASRLWPGAQNHLLAVDGIRHIIQPGINYMYVPRPDAEPANLPQFDSELPSLRLLPIDFPGYNSIDSIDSENVMRLYLRNTLQTRRRGQIEDLVNWETYIDWRIEPQHGQQNFSDAFSDLTFRPRTWLTLESQTRWGIDSADLNLAFHQLTITPSDRWNWSLGHWYIHDGFLGDPGSSLISSIFFYRLTENWGLRTAHYLEAKTGRLEEQDYGIYRDFRSWTGSLTFRLRNETGRANDIALAFTYSLKASPRFGLGNDTLRPYQLLGQDYTP